MTQRDRLIELLTKQCGMTLPVWMAPQTIELLADALLANGVIVPPVKVGDTIYRYGDHIKRVYEWQIAYIEVYEDETVFVDDSDNTFTAENIGKTVFLTREEAEEALKEERA